MKRSEFIQKLLDVAPSDVDPEIAIADWTLDCCFPSVNIAEKIKYNINRRTNEKVSPTKEIIVIGELY